MLVKKKKLVTDGRCTDARTNGSTVRGTKSYGDIPKNSFSSEVIISCPFDDEINIKNCFCNYTKMNV